MRRISSRCVIELCRCPQCARKSGARTLGTGCRVMTYKKRGLRTFVLTTSLFAIADSFDVPQLRLHPPSPTHHPSPVLTMKLTFKDLQQKKFSIDVEPSDTVTPLPPSSRLATLAIVVDHCLTLVFVCRFCR